MSSYKVFKKEAKIQRMLKFSKLTNRVSNTWLLTGGAAANGQGGVGPTLYDVPTTPHMYFMVPITPPGNARVAPLSYTMSYYYQFRGTGGVGSSIFGTGQENDNDHPHDHPMAPPDDERSQKKKPEEHKMEPKILKDGAPIEARGPQEPLTLYNHLLLLK